MQAAGCCSEVEVRRVGRHVLLVDDDRAVANSLGRLLESEGFRVDYATDGETALALARALMYDVILLDRVLPKLSGDRVLEEIRRHAIPTPVVLLTGYPDLGSAFSAGLLGAAAYLTKGSISSAELVSAVSKAGRSAAVSATPRSSLFSAYSGKQSASCADATASLRLPGSTSRSLGIRTLTQTLIAPDLTLVEFLAVSAGIRALRCKEHLALNVILPRVVVWIEEAGAVPASPREERLLAVIEATIATSRTVAEQLRQLRASSPTWLPTRSEMRVVRRCRRAVVMRRAALDLLTSNEYVSQICYRIGYSQPGNFDHDFHAFFGFSPKLFRRVL